MPQRIEASFWDFEWRGVFAYAFLLVAGLYGIVVTSIMFGMRWTWIAITPPGSEMDPSFGFQYRGNSSIFSPAVMARTDMNVTSPTFSKWTPPSGKRPLALVCECVCACA